MKTILFPTDFSEHSKNAFMYALHLAEKFEAEILLFHMYQQAIVDEAFVPVELIEALLAQKKTEAIKHFEAYEQQVQAELGKSVLIRHQLEEGAAVPGIIELAEEVQPDMIVMGTLGAKSLAEKILGSVATQVINKAECPVLAIPEKASYRGFGRIAYATDFQNEDIAFIERLLEFAELFGASVDCIHIKTEDSYWEELQLDFFRKIVEWEDKTDKLYFYTLRHDDVPTGLNHFVHEHDSDLLAMFTHRREPFSTIYNNSLTRAMALFSDIPLMAFK